MRNIIAYERTIKAHIIPHIDVTPVQRVTATAREALYATLRAAGASDDTVHRVHKRLRQMFDYATKRRIIAINPLLAIDAPTVRSAAPTIFTVPQIRRFLRYAATDGYNPLWLLIMQTGMRRGEALGVRWQDLDADSQRLQAVEILHDRPHITTPKTKAGLRTITLFPESIAALKAHKARQNRMHVPAKSVKDAPASPDEVPPDFHIHDLRHMHATHLLQEGWLVAVISRRLGHENPAITLSIYAHALTDTHGDVMQTPTAFAFSGIA